MNEGLWVEEQELADLPALVGRLLPGFETLPLVRRGASGDTSVVSMGEERILRLALNRDRARRLVEERHLLASLRDKLSLAIPQPDVYGAVPTHLSYPWLRGKVWGPWDAEKASGPERTRYAQTLAGLLTELHSLDPSGLSLRTQNWDKDMLGFILRRAGAVKDRDPSGRFEKLLTEVVADFYSWQRSGEKVFLHNDFHPGNVLWNPQRTVLTGLIDFGDCWLGDPHWDFRTLRRLDDALREEVFRVYEARSARQLDRERISKLERFTLVLQVAGRAAEAENLDMALARLFAYADGDRRAD